MEVSRKSKDSDDTRLMTQTAIRWITFGTFLPDPFFRLKTKHMHRVRTIPLVDLSIFNLTEQWVK